MISGGLLLCSLAVGCIWPAAARAQAYRGGLLEAVMLTLRGEPGILAARQDVELQGGVLQTARGEFDTALIAGADLSQTRTPLPAALQGFGRDQPNASNFGLSLGSATRLRSGVVVSPGISVDRVRDNGANATAPASSSVALRFTLPLLKGRGRLVNTAPERAAERNLESAGLNYRHALAAGISRTVNAYWDTLAALRAHAISLESEERSRLLLEDARQLARGDEIPSSDVLQYEAQLARDRTQRIAATQALEESRAAFGVAVGLDAGDAAALPPPTDDFPEPDLAYAGQLPLPAQAAMPPGRADLAALRQQLDAAEILSEAARRDAPSQLDLTFSIGYSGQAENRPPAAALAALGRPASGVNAAIGLSYVLPVEGNQQRGLVRQRSAQAESARVQVEALLRRIRAGISIQHAALRSAALQLAQVRDQVRLQAQVFINERKKYALGQSTVLDVLTAEVQLTQDEQREIAARRQLAQALVNYRFETGTLLAADGGAQLLTLETLTTIPEAR